MNRQSFCYFFIEQCDTTEQYYAGIASSKLNAAATVKDALLAAAELEFWYMVILHFPYSTYNAIAGTGAEEL